MDVHPPHVFTPSTRGGGRFVRSCGICNRVEDYHWHVDYTKTSSETFSGLYFDFANPQASQVSLEDIAQSLSLSCRFTGQISKFYSVAEHALRVSYKVSNYDPIIQLAALHHDSHEAYLGDWSTPLKRAMPGGLVEEMERRCNAAIGEALGIDPALFDDLAVKAADRELLFREAATFTHSRGMGPYWGNAEEFKPLEDPHGWDPEMAERHFRGRHVHLVSQCSSD